jgi:UDP-glucose 4-epimerase
VRRALVTGARGFIGMRAAGELARRGYAVDGIGHGTRADGLDAWIEGSVTAAHLPDARYDVVVHCAGGSSVAKSIDDPAGERSKTVDACAALLEWVSSGAVYGAAPSLPIPEEAPLQPVSPYGAHKVACEELCRSYARSHGMSVAIVRLFSIYGAGLARQLLWDAANKSRTPEPRFAGTGNERRDWLHVSDAVALLALAAEHASSDVLVLNGGSGTGTSVATIVTQLFAELGAPVQPLFDGSQRAGDPSDYVADVTRARSLGWAPTRTLAAGLAEFARWFETCR